MWVAAVNCCIAAFFEWSHNEAVRIWRAMQCLTWDMLGASPWKLACFPQVQWETMPHWCMNQLSTSTASVPGMEDGHVPHLGPTLLACQSTNRRQRVNFELFWSLVNIGWKVLHGNKSPLSYLVSSLFLKGLEQEREREQFWQHIPYCRSYFFSFLGTVLLTWKRQVSWTNCKHNKFSLILKNPFTILMLHKQTRETNGYWSDIRLIKSVQRRNFVCL